MHSTFRREALNVAHKAARYKTGEVARRLASEATSDFWEPVVKDLLNVIDTMVETGGYMHDHQRLVNEIKEGLSNAKTSRL